MPSLVWEVLDSAHGPLITLMIAKTDPTKDEWDAYLEALRDLIKRHPNASFRAIVLTDGGAPNGRQRAQHTEVVASVAARSAIVSDSAVVRGVVTVLGWLSRNIAYRMFSSADAFGVLDYLDLGRDEVARIVSNFSLLRQRLGGSEIGTRFEGALRAPQRVSG